MTPLRVEPWMVKAARLAGTTPMELARLAQAEQERIARLIVPESHPSFRCEPPASPKE